MPAGAKAPLSSVQSRILDHCLEQPDSKQYHRLLLIAITQPIDIQLLERSLALLMNRHASLRTSFPICNGLPEIAIAADADARFTLHIEQIKFKDLESRDIEASIRVKAFGAAPFDLAHGPLFRGCLLYEEPALTEVYVALSMHHLVSDGWSDTVLLRDLDSIYSVLTAPSSGDVPGKLTDLPSLPIQYGDYAAWSREREASAPIQRQLAYSRGRFDVPIVPLNLPGQINSRRSDTASRYSFEFNNEMSYLLKRLAAQEGCTLFMALLAGLNVLLYRYCNQSDIHVASPISGRTHTDAENLVGCFINTIILRVEVNGLSSFRSLLAQVRDVCLSGFDNAEPPFEQVIENVVLPPGVSHDELFQVLFQVRNVPKRHVSAGINFRRVPVDTGSLTHQLSFEFCEQGGTIVGTVDYADSRFSADFISRMCESLQSILTAACLSPDFEVGRLNVVSDTDVAQMYRNNALKQALVPHGITFLHELFIAAARQFPDAIAIDVPPGDGRPTRSIITYSELDALTDRIAAGIQGFTIETLIIGILMDRTSNLLCASQIGVLKTGATFLAIDSAFPDSQIRNMLSQCSVQLVLTDSVGMGRVDSLRKTAGKEPCIYVDVRSQLQLSWNSRSYHDIESSDTDRAAYIICTSGTTGTPRAVVVPHRSILNLILSDLIEFDIKPDDRLAQGSSAAYDSSVEETWMALASGATLVLMDNDSVRLGPHLVGWLHTERITILSPAPTLLRSMGLLGADNALPALRLVYAGGEDLPRDVADVWSRGRRLVNGYGPTEATVVALRKDVSPEQAITFGRPVPGVQAWIVNEFLELSPIGVPGELCIGGIGLSLGYLAEPGLNAVKFPVHPVVGRVYRTGDIAVLQDDGDIRFLGRIDAQVKLRGYRIELGAIEAVITACDGVRAAACCVKGSGEMQYVAAFIVPVDAVRLPDRVAIRAAVVAQLPAYMAPTRIGFVDDLPVAVSGKLWREALPDPVLESVVISEDQVPRSLLERQLCRIWGEVLGLPAVGIDEGFFELGGNSLHAIRLFTRLEAEVGVRGQISLLHKAPSVRKLARDLSLGMELPCSRLVPLQPLGTKPPVFCMYRLDGLDICYRELVAELGLDQPVYSVLPHLPEDGSEPLSEMSAIAAHCVQDIQSRFPDGPYVLVGSSFGGKVAYEVGRQLEASGAEPALVVLLDTTGPEALIHRRPKSRFIKFFTHFRVMLALPSEKRAAYLSSKLGRGKNSGADAHEEKNNARLLPADLQRVVATHLKTVDNYQTGPLRANLILFRAAERNPFRHDDDPHMWWGDLISCEQIEDVPGNHTSMLEEPHVAVLAQRMKARIAQALASA